jgi:hypothetical protein
MRVNSKDVEYIFNEKLRPLLDALSDEFFTEDGHSKSDVSSIKIRLMVDHMISVLRELKKLK